MNKRLVISFLILVVICLSSYACGETIYFLVAEPSLEGVTGKYFNLTIEEKPAWYSVKAELSQQVWEHSQALIEPYLSEVL